MKNSSSNIITVTFSFWTWRLHELKFCSECVSKCKIQGSLRQSFQNLKSDRIHSDWQKWVHVNIPNGSFSWKKSWLSFSTYFPKLLFCKVWIRQILYHSPTKSRFLERLSLFASHLKATLQVSGFCRYLLHCLVKNATELLSFHKQREYGALRSPFP